MVLPLGAVLVLYAAGTLRLWRRAGVGRGAGRLQTGLFAAGLAVLALTLLSPLGDYSAALFTAHMIEHELLMAVAAPLIALSRPAGILLAGLPRRARRALIGVIRSRAGAIAALAVRPTPATLLHAAAIWLWHFPRLFEAALRHDWLHWLQHGSFFGTGLLFWWSFAARRRDRAGHASAIGHLFATSLHMCLLGAILVLSPRPWYARQGAGAAAFGLTPLEDQQLAGLVMWVPGGLVYAAAALVFAGLLIAAGPPSPRPATTTS